MTQKESMLVQHYVTSIEFKLLLAAFRSHASATEVSSLLLKIRKIAEKYGPKPPEKSP